MPSRIQAQNHYMVINRDYQQDINLLELCSNISEAKSGKGCRRGDYIAKDSNEGNADISWACITMSLPI
jgi:hypothetical protein